MIAGFRRLAVAWWRLGLLGLAFVLGLAPIIPVYPSTGFDRSWVTGIQVASDTGAVWGIDVAYTIGPLGHLYTSAWSPQLGWIVPGIGLLYCLISAALTARLLGSLPWWTTVAAALLLTGGFIDRDTLYLLPPYVLAALIVTEDHERPVSRTRWRLAVLSVPAGLIPLVKLSGVPVAVLAVGVCVLVLGLRKDWLGALVAIATPLLTLVAAWLLLGQPLTALPDWALSIPEVIGGYSQALALAGPFRYVVTFAVASTVVTVVALARFGPTRSQLERLGFALLTAATCFLAFKAGFVRQDGHVLVAISSLLAIVGVVVTRVPRPWALGTMAVGVATWLVVGTSVSGVGIGITSTALHRSWVDAPRAVADRVLTPHKLRDRYRAARASIRDDPASPEVGSPGTYDLYTSELSFLLAQDHATWSPRPALQSITAYTPKLAEMDREHLDGDDRPDHLFVRFDLRQFWAPLGDGSSWLSMARWYDVGGTSGDFLRLDVRQSPRTIEYGNRTTVTVHTGINAELVTPPGWDGLVATVELNPTLRGKLVETALRASQVDVEERLDDGSTFDKRFLPELGSVETVVSPHLNSANALAALIDPSSTDKPLRRTLGLRLIPHTPADWSDQTTVSYRPFRIVHGTGN